MNEQVKFFPDSEEFKTPLGAVKAGEPVKLTLKFNRPSNPSEVFLVLTKDGESDVYYPMSFVSVDHEYTMEYNVSVTVTTRGLYFYHFKIGRASCRERVSASV